LKNKEPDIDDINQIANLEIKVKSYLGDLKGLARAFKAVLFFFELDRPITHEGS